MKQSEILREGKSKRSIKPAPINRRPSSPPPGQKSPMNNSQLFLVGQYKSGVVPNVTWEFQGVFTSMKRAIRNCRDSNYFILPFKINKSFPHETITMRTYWPKQDVWAE